MRARLQRLSTVAAVLLLAASVAGSCGAWHWALDLASHFRWYWLLAAVAGLAVSAWRPRSLSFAGFALAVVGNAWAMLPFWLPPPAALSVAVAADPDDGDVPPLTLISANLHRRNPDKSLAVAYLRDRQPDVAVLLEVDADWAANLSSLDDVYPFRIVEPRMGSFGIAVLSRWPLIDQRVREFGGTVFPNIETIVRFHECEVRLFATHPHLPDGPESAARLVAQLGDLAVAAAAAKRPCIVAGDFNATPWSLPYRVFTARSGLRDTALGRGVQATWNARWPAPRIPIDHVFASPDVIVLRRSVGPDIGSDHFPVEATLLLPPAE